MSENIGHVFVSHSSDNRELAKELAAFLESRKLKVWIAPRDVRPGMDYSEELQRAIENCSAFVVLVTDTANKSPYVRAETEMAFSSHKPIFPVRTSEIEPAAGLAFFLKIRHWTDAFGASRADNLQRLIRELQAHGAAAAAERQASAPPTTAAPPAAQSQSQAQVAPAPIAAATTPPVATVPPAEPDDPELVEAAVGTNAAYYLAKWQAMDAKRSAMSWNWPACLANLFWFAWRKMWLPMIGVLVAFVLLAALGSVNPTAARVTVLLSIAVTFVAGLFGNHLYRAQTRRLVASTMVLERSAQLQALRSRGRTSVPALAVSIGLIVIFLLLALIGAISQQKRLVISPADPTNLFGGTTDEGLSGEVDLGDKPPAEEDSSSDR